MKTLCHWALLQLLAVTDLSLFQEWDVRNEPELSEWLARTSLLWKSSGQEENCLGHGLRPVPWVVWNSGFWQCLGVRSRLWVWEGSSAFLASLLTFNSSHLMNGLGVREKGDDSLAWIIYIWIALVLKLIFLKLKFHSVCAWNIHKILFQESLFPKLITFWYIFGSASHYVFIILEPLSPSPTALVLLFLSPFLFLSGFAYVHWWNFLTLRILYLQWKLRSKQSTGCLLYFVLYFSAM